MKKIIGLFLIILVGCQTIYQDKSPAPINNNLMTLEMFSCNKRDAGLLGCFYKNNINDNLSIPLWEKGEYQIKSEVCNYFQNKRYVGNQTLNLTYSELIKNKPESEETCLYNIKVFIDGFDNGFEGFFLLSNLDDFSPINFIFENKEYEGYAGLQIIQGADIKSSFKFIKSYSGTLYWEGCNTKGAYIFDKNVELKFKEILPNYLWPSDSCVLTLGIVPNDSKIKKELGAIHINIFDKNIVPLSEPSVNYQNNKLKVDGEYSLAAIAINEDFKLFGSDSKKIFNKKISQDEEALVRTFTSNGRFGLLKVKNGIVIWKASYHY